MTPEQMIDKLAAFEAKVPSGIRMYYYRPDSPGNVLPQSVIQTAVGVDDAPNLFETFGDDADALAEFLINTRNALPWLLAMAREAVAWRALNEVCKGSGGVMPAMNRLDDARATSDRLLREIGGGE